MRARHGRQCAALGHENNFSTTTLVWCAGMTGWSLLAQVSPGTTALALAAAPCPAPHQRRQAQHGRQHSPRVPPQAELDPRLQLLLAAEDPSEQEQEHEHGRPRPPSAPVAPAVWIRVLSPPTPRAPPRAALCATGLAGLPLPGAALLQEQPSRHVLLCATRLHMYGGWGGGTCTCMRHIAWGAATARYCPGAHPICRNRTVQPAYMHVLYIQHIHTHERCVYVCVV